MTGGNRSVSSKDALLADGVDVCLGGITECVACELLFEQCDRQKRGVALVHVEDGGLAAEGAEDGNTAETEDGLLQRR